MELEQAGDMLLSAPWLAVEVGLQFESIIVWALEIERMRHVAKTMSVDVSRATALKFVVLIGVVSLFADMTYEAARSITGPYLQSTWWPFLSWR